MIWRTFFERRLNTGRSLMDFLNLSLEPATGATTSGHEGAAPGYASAETCACRSHSLRYRQHEEKPGAFRLASEPGEWSGRNASDTSRPTAPRCPILDHIRKRIRNAFRGNLAKLSRIDRINDHYHERLEDVPGNAQERPLVADRHVADHQNREDGRVIRRAWAWSKAGRSRREAHNSPRTLIVAPVP